MHKDFAEVYMNDNIKDFIGLAPRGFGKSELVAFGFSLHGSLFHPIISRGGVQAVCSEGKDLAIDRIETISAEIEKNVALKAFFGNLQGKMKRVDQIDIHSESMDINTKTFGRGKGQAFQGMKKLHSRPYMILFDDLEPRDDCTNPDAIEKNKKWLFRTAREALAEYGRIFYIATLMAPESLTHQISRLSSWYTLLYSAIKPDGTMLWDEHMNSEQFARKFREARERGDEEGMWLEYMNLPVNPEAKEISYKHIKYFRPEEVKDTIKNFYIIIDPSFATKKESDITGIVIAGIDDIGNIYLYEALYSHAKDPKSVVEAIFPYISIYKPMGIYIESFGAQRVMVSPIQDLLKEESVVTPVMGVTGEYTVGAKFIRIRRFISKIKVGAERGGTKDVHGNIIPEVIFNIDSPGIKLLARDLLVFPEKAGHGDYDVLDAASYIHKVAVKPKVFREEGRKTDWDEMMEDIERQYGKKHKDFIHKII